MSVAIEVLHYLFWLAATLGVSKAVYDGYQAATQSDLREGGHH